MRIAILAGYWNPPCFRGGISRVIFELRKVWVRQGHTVHVYAPQTTTDPQKGIFRVPVPRVPLRGIFINLYLSLFIDLDSYDILFPQSLFQAVFLNKEKCVPFVHTLSQVEYKTPWRFWRYTIPFIEKYAAKDLPACVVLSKKAQKTLCTHFSFQSHTVLQCKNGVDYQLFKPDEHFVTDQVFTVLTAGRFIPRKRFHLLIQAFAIFAENRPETQLIIAGDGELKSELKNLAQSLNISNQVFFPGMMNSGAMIKLYRKASIFVFPSKAEGMPMAVLEAQSSGLPVIIGDFDTSEDLVINRQTGFIIKQDDPEIWKKAIEKLYQSPELRYRIARDARKRILKQFSWEYTADSIMTHFKTMVGEHR